MHRSNITIVLVLRKFRVLWGIIRSVDLHCYLQVQLPLLIGRDALSAGNKSTNCCCKAGNLQTPYTQVKKESVYFTRKRTDRAYSKSPHRSC
jgi:hypothetical protein